MVRGGLDSSAWEVTQGTTRNLKAKGTKMKERRDPGIQRDPETRHIKKLRDSEIQDNTKTPRNSEVSLETQRLRAPETLPQQVTPVNSNVPPALAAQAPFSGSASWRLRFCKGEGGPASLPSPLLQVRKH